VKEEGIYSVFLHMGKDNGKIAPEGLLVRRVKERGNPGSLPRGDSES
jgi:hypothetical protein